MRVSLAGPVNQTVLRESLRDATAALELHLDALRARGGLADRVRNSQPRLLTEVQRLDVGLSSLLASLWGAQKDLASGDSETVARLDELASEMDRVAERETALLHETQVELGGLD